MELWFTPTHCQLEQPPQGALAHPPAAGRSGAAPAACGVTWMELRYTHIHCTAGAAAAGCAGASTNRRKERGNSGRMCRDLDGAQLTAHTLHSWNRHGRERWRLH